MFGEPKATLEQVLDLQRTVASQQRILADHTKIMDKMLDVITVLHQRVEALRNFNPHPN